MTELEQAWAALEQSLLGCETWAGTESQTKEERELSRRQDPQRFYVRAEEVRAAARAFGLVCIEAASDATAAGRGFWWLEERIAKLGIPKEDTHDQ